MKQRIACTSYSEPTQKQAVQPRQNLEFLAINGREKHAVEFEARSSSEAGTAEAAAAEELKYSRKRTPIINIVR